MRCINCKHMKLVLIEGGCGASIKCFKTSKRGKTITWAMTTVFPKREEGEDRVINVLKSQKDAPKWCPMKKDN